MNTVLQTSLLRKKYGQTIALDDLNLELPQGKIVGLLGPNGSGKTTLIKLTAGLLAPTSGNVSVCGLPIGPESKALVSYLPDRVYFNQNQTVIQLINFFQDMYADFDRIRAGEILQDLGIDLNTKFKALSKGGREKVQLALVMARRARLYLLDEPIAGVDPAARDYILHTIVNNYASDATVLISTHLIADVESILDEYIFIHKGKILRQGSVAETVEETGKSLDELFREVFRCLPNF